MQDEYLNKIKQDVRGVSERWWFLVLQRMQQQQQQTQMIHMKMKVEATADTDVTVKEIKMDVEPQVNYKSLQHFTLQMFALIKKK